MILYLQNHPLVGSAAGIVGPTIGFATNFFAADSTVKTIGIMSVYIGFFIAILTGVIKIIELYQKLSKKKDNNKP